MTTYMYKRYVDDAANATEAISPGTRWSPGGWRSCGVRAQFLQQEKLEFKHLCDDWREGSICKKPLTSRCRPDVMKPRFDCCI